MVDSDRSWPDSLSDTSHPLNKYQSSLRISPPVRADIDRCSAAVLWLFEVISEGNQNLFKVEALCHSHSDKFLDHISNIVVVWCIIFVLNSSFGIKQSLKVLLIDTVYVLSFLSFIKGLSKQMMEVEVWKKLVRNPLNYKKRCYLEMRFIIF